MTLLLEYERATRDAELARLRRVLALRAMVVEGMSQTEIARQLGVTQPAVSYQVAAERTQEAYPRDLIAAGGSLLRQFAEQRGFADLAVFGSVARGTDRMDSDVDLLVLPPEDADYLDFLRLKDDLAAILARPVDLISYRGLDSELSGDILRDRMLL